MKKTRFVSSPKATTSPETHSKTHRRSWPKNRDVQCQQAWRWAWLTSLPSNLRRRHHGQELLPILAEATEHRHHRILLKPQRVVHQDDLAAEVEVLPTGEEVAARNVGPPPVQVEALAELHPHRCTNRLGETLPTDNRALPRVTLERLRKRWPCERPPLTTPQDRELEHTKGSLNPPPRKQASNPLPHRTPIAQGTPGVAGCTPAAKTTGEGMPLNPPIDNTRVRIDKHMALSYSPRCQITPKSTRPCGYMVTAVCPHAQPNYTGCKRRAKPISTSAQLTRSAQQE